jgi:multidrug transporter EmrE-like cation transporter
MNVKVVAAFFLIVISALVMFKALSANSFTFVVPLATGINFLLTIAVGYYLFNDQFSVVKISGIIFILTGIILLSIGEKTISGN